MLYYIYLPEPTTTNRKNPKISGPTGNFSFFFCYNKLNVFLTVREFDTFPLLSTFLSKVSFLSLKTLLDFTLNAKNSYHLFIYNYNQYTL